VAEPMLRHRIAPSAEGRARQARALARLALQSGARATRQPRQAWPRRRPWRVSIETAAGAARMIQHGRLPPMAGADAALRICWRRALADEDAAQKARWAASSGGGHESGARRWPRELPTESAGHRLVAGALAELAKRTSAAEDQAHPIFWGFSSEDAAAPRERSCAPPFQRPIFVPPRRWTTRCAFSTNELRRAQKQDRVRREGRGRSRSNVVER